MSFRKTFLALLLISASFSVASAAGGVTADQVENSFSPLLSLVQGLGNLGWKILQITIGMDASQIAYFTNQLGFRKEVQLTDLTTKTIDSVKVELGALDCEASTPQSANCLSPTESIVKISTLNVNDGDCDENTQTMVVLGGDSNLPVCGSGDEGQTYSTISYSTTISPQKIAMKLVEDGYAEYSTGSTINSDDSCSINSFKTTTQLANTNTNDVVTCVNSDGNPVALVNNNGVVLTLSQIGDLNNDEETNIDDVFQYLLNNEQAMLQVSDSAKIQVMLFAFLIPLGILVFLLRDFFVSTGMVRSGTADIISISIALIAARTGAYTGLLNMIGNIFGGGGFFMSLLSIYLLIAIILWFYGGIVRGKAVAEAQDQVAQAVVQGFSYDLQRGIMGKEAAEALAKQKSGK